ncbi:HU family DNA-binding protein [Mesoplasma tabanidae]|uniref:Uncharacterized protein n=1 Tax=Mesoplasma tabanidae TaxID=219745 RepID=A0A2K8P4J5_9MOLU|nr:HU family DNA-binding protein [Mesoplasma tabanidae]ATZ21626.1 hypothetical protein MTABA_v1c04270 [Mesoplasma tabanidae]
MKRKLNTLKNYNKHLWIKKYFRLWISKSKYNKVYKKDIINALDIKHQEISKIKITNVVNRTLESIQNELFNQQIITIRDFGSLKVVKNKKQLRIVKFTPSKTLKEKMQATEWTGKYWQLKKIKRKKKWLILLLLLLACLLSITATTITIITVTGQTTQRIKKISFNEQRLFIQNLVKDKIYDSFNDFEKDVKENANKQVLVTIEKTSTREKSAFSKIETRIKLVPNEGHEWDENKDDLERSFEQQVLIKNNKIVKKQEVETRLNQILNLSFNNESDLIAKVNKEFADFENIIFKSAFLDQNQQEENNYIFIFGIENDYVWDDQTQDDIEISKQVNLSNKIVSLAKTIKHINQYFEDYIFVSELELDTYISEFNYQIETINISKDNFNMQTSILTLKINLNNDYYWSDETREEVILQIVIKGKE